MSLIGLKNFRVVKLTEDSSSALTYDTVITNLIGAKNVKISPKSDTAENYGDDQLLETATSMGAIEVEIEIAELTLEQYALLTGYTYKEGLVTETKDFNPPYVALGFEATKSTNGSRCVWLTKGKCEPIEEENKTKEEKVDFQSSKLKLKFMPRIKDGVAKYKADTDGTTPVKAADFFTVDYLTNGKKSIAV